MRYRWLALVIVLALILMPRDGIAQSGTTARKSAGTLSQNYPNPFNPDTHGGFKIDDPPSCPDGGKIHRVSIKIYNIIGQLVAVPILVGGVGNVAGGSTLENVMLPCGSYTWFWDGFYQNSGKREAASGVYLLVLEVDGKKMAPKRMTNTK